MFVKPSRPDLRVLDPMCLDDLPPEGREVEPTQYWQRRIIENDVVQAIPEDAPPVTVGQKKEA